MKFTVEIPATEEYASPDAVRRVAGTLEAAGFDAAGYTDHPAPSRQWVNSASGYPTFDPFAALGFLAAVTTELRIMTYLAVLPYRNPFLTAKSVATLDRLSGGRFTLVAGTGYLRSEFEALGQPFEERNELFDEAIDVLDRAWTTDPIAYEGADFSAIAQASEPPPLQLPHPPIWIGGSSRRSRQRAATIGQGWSPLMASPDFARNARTAPLEGTDELAAAWAEVRSMASAAGRDPDQLSLQVDGLVDVETMLKDPDAALEQVAVYEEVGVTHLLVRPPAGPLDEAVEMLERFGREIINP